MSLGLVRRVLTEKSSFRRWVSRLILLRTLRLLPLLVGQYNARNTQISRSPREAVHSGDRACLFLPAQPQRCLPWPQAWGMSLVRASYAPGTGYCIIRLAHSYRRAFFHNFRSSEIIGDMYQFTEAFCHYSENSPEAKKIELVKFYQVQENKFGRLKNCAKKWVILMGEFFPIISTLFSRNFSIFHISLIFFPNTWNSK